MKLSNIPNREPERIPQITMTKRDRISPIVRLREGFTGEHPDSPPPPPPTWFPLLDRKPLVKITVEEKDLQANQINVEILIPVIYRIPGKGHVNV